ncbi:fluoride efflux transporter CrcB [filamentous cyanobacterium CCT1]|nr:fluoride efflux transporter CrcB [filamentous cyanobacterium CCT1]PSN78393.1 fluoride efflux transporter CrcB [filamentous cyanobacterium CCP4]
MQQQPVVRTIAAIALGAIAGALSRYYIGLSINNILGTTIPFSTLIINITGCFGMGLLVVLLATPAISRHPDLKLLLLTGFLGSYTTFSSYELDSANLLAQEQIGPALFYWIGSLCLGLLSLSLGILLSERLLIKLGENDLK